ncbi:disintegrin and metalloproteinase domain-containing protein 28 [Nephila pilipes]|uniref:Disintegrin and metalloproteinase domain-containing protein 28 n=1 Tax=Nephila pilipes TaxID=299642 RepID=A0A8X6I732_NEPPI|nr:disintegrin and metalloproteinase domain-containing protein 28 [Nephila pilipes]
MLFSSQECAKQDPCCDPVTCRLIKHAECSSGSCCKRCKLLSSDQMCRPSEGECDIPEFCDGKNGQCPNDLFKKTEPFVQGLGYCFQGQCPLLKTQCQNLGTRTFSSTDLKHGLVKDGTKCGYQKLCLNLTCTSIRSIISGKCPLEEVHSTCSGHGICTNINTCYCEEGWKGPDCSIVEEVNQLGNANKDSDYYDSMGESLLESSQYENELRLNPNLAITVLAACIFIGLVLVVIAVLFIFNRNLWTAKSASN